MSTQPTDEEIRELWSQYNPLHGIQSFARSVLVNWGTPSGDAETAKELRRLHAEIQRYKQVCAATSECWLADAESWKAQRDSLLEALVQLSSVAIGTDHGKEFGHEVDLALAAIRTIKASTPAGGSKTHSHFCLSRMCCQLGEKRMNERIRELAVEADLLIKKNNGAEFRYGNFDPRFQKFAELIVRECANFTDPVTRKLMMKHFGVEE